MKKKIIGISIGIIGVILCGIGLKKEEQPICEHSYVKYDSLTSTCKENGYIQYVCTKCDDVYTETLLKEHLYEKYFCRDCGKIYPKMDSTFAAINTWISEYGELHGNGIYYHYPNAEAVVTLSSQLDAERFFYIDHKNPLIEESIYIYIGNEGVLSVRCTKGETCGIFKTSIAAYSPEEVICFDDFSTSEEEPIDEEAFALEYTKKVEKCLGYVQEGILYPKAGITLKNFGFNCF